ncbi:MAG: spore coat U domain-containing protein [Terracidiphilus sp.]|nr:spore coat U domain-containing protein [Terracidiphilus sp.]
MMRKLALIVMLLAAAAFQRASAQTCSVSITSPLAFGTYTGTQIRSSTPAKITCTGSWQMPLNAGTGAGGTTTVRKLTGPGGAELSYQLFRDSAYSLNWGNTTGVDVLTGTGSQQVYIYAQLLSGQTGPAGTYTDTVNSATTSFVLTVVIAANCSISANPLAFGSYTGALLNATTTLSVSCTSGTAYNVGLSAGNGSGATVTTRAMTGPSSAQLKYSLFSNSGRTTNWGNTTGSWVGGTGTGAAQSLSVYGQIPAGQYPTPGSYTDTITATVNY